MCDHAHDQLRLLQAGRASWVWGWGGSNSSRRSVALWLPEAGVCCCGRQGVLGARLSRLVFTQRLGGCSLCRGAGRLAAIIVCRPARARPCQSLSSSSLQACRREGCTAWAAQHHSNLVSQANRPDCIRKI